MGRMLPYTTYLIDLDGVIYRGNEVLPGAKEFVAWLEAQRKKYLYLTNNSFATAAQVLAKLNRLGIPADEAHMLTAGQAAVQYIARRCPNGSIYVVGEMPLIELVESQGLTVTPVDSPKADAVLVGLDRDFDYMKLNCAMNAVRAGALFVAINTGNVTLVPSTVIALRANAHAAQPADILVPTLLASFCSTVAAIVAARLLARLSRYRRQFDEAPDQASPAPEVAP